MAPIPRNRRVRREVPASGWKAPEKQWLCPECEKKLNEWITSVGAGVLVGAALVLLTLLLKELTR